MTVSLTQYFESMLAAPVSPELAARFQFPKCPHCHRRPELFRVRGKDIIVQERLDDPATVAIPRYEILPCCSVKYIVTINHATRKQKIQAAAATEAKHGTPKV